MLWKKYITDKNDIYIELQDTKGTGERAQPKLPASTEVNVSEIFKRAKSHLERGSKNAILGQYRTAYNDYDCGLRALSQAIEVENNPDKKNSMKNILLQYLDLVNL